MLHLAIKGAKVRVKAVFWGEGSVRAETVDTSCTEVETILEIDSEEDPKMIAKLARVSEAGCYVIQSLRRPTPVSLKVSLNGGPLDYQDGAPGSPRPPEPS
jgi:hypothetical protein